MTDESEQPPKASEPTRIDPKHVDPKHVDPKHVDPKLLEILVCPLTKGRLDYDSARQELISRQAKLVFPIRDGIPIMLPDEARPLVE